MQALDEARDEVRDRELDRLIEKRAEVGDPEALDEALRKAPQAKADKE